MAIPANTFTTETAILNQLTAELRTVTGMNEASVFISAVPVWLDAPPGDRYIEIIPGVAQDINSKNGNYGRMQDSFTLCIFWRLMVDQDGRDTVRIADSSIGLLQFIDTVVQKISASFLRGQALVPVLPQRREAGERNQQDPYDGWVMMRRTFTVEYLTTMPGPQSVS